MVIRHSILHEHAQLFPIQCPGPGGFPLGDPGFPETVDETSKVKLDKHAESTDVVASTALSSGLTNPV